jgi:hypothetical protein
VAGKERTHAARDRERERERERKRASASCRVVREDIRRDSRESFSEPF